MNDSKTERIFALAQALAAVHEEDGDCLGDASRELLFLLEDEYFEPVELDC